MNDSCRRIVHTDAYTARTIERGQGSPAWREVSKPVRRGRSGKKHSGLGVGKNAAATRERPRTDRAGERASSGTTRVATEDRQANEPSAFRCHA